MKIVYNKIFYEKVIIRGTRAFDVERAVFVMETKYRNEWDESQISDLFGVPCKSIDEFTKLDKKLREDFRISAEKKFIENFVVDSCDEIHKQTIVQCIEIFKYIRALNYFIFRKSMSDKEMRKKNLEEFRDFFRSFRLDGSTTTQSFLADTLNDMIELDIDCIQFEASVAIDYVLAYLCNLANIKVYEELLEFISLLDNAYVFNVNHNYLQSKFLIFHKTNLVEEDDDSSYVSFFFA